MGVRYLLTYISKNVPNGVSEVSIEKEVQNYKSNNEGQRPIVVIDLLSISRLFCNNKHEQLLGGRYSIYNDRVIELFDKLKSLDIILVFFTDGPTQPDKIPVLLKRRNQQYSRAMEALRYLSHKLRIDPPNMAPFLVNLAEIVARYGDVHITTLNDCDLELAEYATRKDAFAVISNDTDFLIYEGDWHLWSTKGFNIKTLRIKKLNKTALRQELKLSIDEMPIFATMSGNDYVPFESIEVRYNRTRRSEQDIAADVRKLKCSFKTIFSSDIQNISNLIFTDSRRTSNLKLIETSLNAYNLSKLHTEHKNEILKRTSQDAGRLNYVILADITYILNLYYFDLSKTDLMPFYEMISPLLRKILGILLMNGVKDHNITRTFYCKFQENKPFEKKLEHPVYPNSSYQVPAVEELLYEPFGMNKELDEKRMKLLCWEISSNLTSDMVDNLPKDDVINVVTIFYLRELNQIDINEADCLLLANYSVKEMPKSVKLNNCKQINERDARLAFLFTIMHVYIENCFYAVGLSHLSSLVTFDGLYFHHLRRTWNTNSEHDKETILNKYKHLRIY